MEKAEETRIGPYGLEFRKVPRRIGVREHFESVSDKRIKVYPPEDPSDRDQHWIVVYNDAIDPDDIYEITGEREERRAFGLAEIFSGTPIRMANPQPVFVAGHQWVWNTDGPMLPHWRNTSGNTVCIFPPDDDALTWIVFTYRVPNAKHQEDTCSPAHFSGPMGMRNAFRAGASGVTARQPRQA